MITEGPNSHTFVYDNFGRIKSDSQLIDTKTYLISYAYNLASQITSITYPSTTRVVVQNYDAIGRVCAIGASGSTCTTGTRYLNSPTYNAAGETLSVTFGNNVQGAFTYNDHLQLSTLRYFKNSTEILNLAYDYTSGVSGNNGQIQKVHYYTTPGAEDLTKSENFTYDQQARLSAAQTGVVNSTSGAKTWSLQRTYDRFGNRLIQQMLAGDPSFPVGQPTLMINTATNQITNSDYTYDNAGNMTHDATAAYTYDGANRLTAINTTGAVYSYFARQRIKKVVGSTTTRYIYSGNQPIAEYTGSTTPTLSTEYIYAGSKLLVTLAGSTTTYHHPDHLSNRAETNSSGTRTRTFGQLPFGETWYETGTADKWKFTGYERDSGTGETGLDYAKFRYYSSPQGRFMSADLLAGHIGGPQSLNRYSYTGGDPINLKDPLGLDASMICENDMVRWSFDGGETWTPWYPSGSVTCPGGIGGGGNIAPVPVPGGPDDPPDRLKKQRDFRKWWLQSLADCLKEIYKIDLKKFDPTSKGMNGLFEGKDAKGTITVVNDVGSYTATGLSWVTLHPDTVGWTPRSTARNQTNYTASDLGGDEDLMDFVGTQIHELGHSLDMITSGSVFGTSEESAGRINDCLTQKGKDRINNMK